MTTTAVQRGWGDPDAAGFRRNIAPITAAGISVPVHKRVADVFTYLLTAVGRTYDLAGFGDDWGYCNRCIRGTGIGTVPCVKSNHSWGLAVDLDASINPMTTDLAAKHEFVRAVIDPILAPFDGRLLWGGEYAGTRKDYMHFEYVGTPAQAVADSARAARLLRTPQPVKEDYVATLDPDDKAELIQAITGGVRPRDHHDTDPKVVSNADLLTAIDQLPGKIAAALKATT